VKDSQKPLLVIIIFVLLTACARPGSPTGGPQDTEPPKVVYAHPPDKSIYFTGREIQLTFDEFITLKDIQSQLLISPPLKERVKTTLKKKTLIIELPEDLNDSTTYTFSFGKSITDLNEGNVAAGLKYVISTGSYLDSLKFSGKVTDAFTSKPEKEMLILLYEVSDTITRDSVLYKAFPDYFAISDEQGQFEFENLRPGAFWMYGLLDKNADYLYGGPPEKIAIFDEVINTDSVPPIHLVAFLERPKIKFLNAQYKEYGRIDFNFNGKPDSLKVFEYYEELDSTFNINMRMVPNLAADTLSFWFAPTGNDEKKFLIYLDTASVPDTAKVFLRASKMGGFKVLGKPATHLNPGDTFSFELNHPVQQIDLEKIEVVLHDSIPVKSQIVQDANNPLKVWLTFERDWEQAFKIIAQKAAFKDIFGQESDSTGFPLSTKTPDDYGNWKLQMEGDSVDYILDILDEKGQPLKTRFFSGNANFDFSLMPPGKYKLRVIVDTNRNHKWDPGSLKDWIFSEKVLYNNDVVEIRANWDIDTTWDIREKTLQDQFSKELPETNDNKLKEQKSK
jgi:hypothetical protein